MPGGMGMDEHAWMLEGAGRLGGALYVFAGWAVLRSYRMNRLLDDALSALTMKPVAARDRRETQGLLVIGFAVLAAGALLLALSALAVPVFVVVAVLLVWQFVAARRDREDGDARATAWAWGAPALFLSVSALVAALAATGGLHAPDDWRSFLLAGVVAFFVGAEPFLPRPGGRKAAAAWDEATDFPLAEPPPPQDPAAPRRVRLAPSWGSGPLFDDDTGEWLDPAADLGLPTALTSKIDAWDASFQAVLDPDYPPDGRFQTREGEAAYLAEGEEIAEDLRGVLGADRVVVRLPYGPQD